MSDPSGDPVLGRIDRALFELRHDQVWLLDRLAMLAREVAELKKALVELLAFVQGEPGGVDLVVAMNAKLDAITAAVARLETEEVHMSQELDDLKAEVAQVTSVQQSAITLIQGISQKLADAIAANDPAALVQLKTDLDASTQALAAAVAANTPTAPPA